MNDWIANCSSCCSSVRLQVSAASGYLALAGPRFCSMCGAPVVPVQVYQVIDRVLRDGGTIKPTLVYGD